MKVYKSKFTLYRVLFSLGFLSLELWFLLNKLFIEALGCFLWTLVPIGFTWLSYQWRFITADDYMQIDSIMLGEKINWNEVIAAEDMTYDNGMYLLRVINKDQMFKIPVKLLKGKDIIAIVNYMNQKTKQYQIPFNHGIPHFKSMYYQYKPNILSNIGYFIPTLHEKMKVWKYSVWIILMLIASFIIKRVEWQKITDALIEISIIMIFAMAVLGWLHLLFAQFPQNLRAIEHNQRKQHDQMFVPTVASAKPYRLPFVLVSGVLVLLIAGFAWYLTR